MRRYFAQSDRRHGTITFESADGESVSGLAVAIISNCSPWTYLGNRPLRPTPGADFNGGLDVFGLTSLGLVSTLSSLALMTTQRGPRGRRVVALHDQNTFILRSSKPLPAQVDGDYIGEREAVTIDSVPNAIGVAY